MKVEGFKACWQCSINMVQVKSVTAGFSLCGRKPAERGKIMMVDGRPKPVGVVVEQDVPVIENPFREFAQWQLGIGRWQSKGVVIRRSADGKNHEPFTANNNAYSTGEKVLAILRLALLPLTLVALIIKFCDCLINHKDWDRFSLMPRFEDYKKYEKLQN